MYVGEDLLDSVGSIVAERSPGMTPIVVCARRVFADYGERVVASFPDGTFSLAIDDSEQQKTMATVETILTKLLHMGARRDSVMIVVGGGVLGDTAGFAASIYLRGIDLVHVPTTLLAQVDSSIGGKVGVNHPFGKNLIGSFCAPRAVISDVGVLKTLPRRELLSGLYEALKSGVISDPGLFDLIESNKRSLLKAKPEVMLEIVKRSADVKGAIVSEDEREADRRRLLNYGHTLAHALETALNYEKLTHGEAVAWGMIAANAVARSRKLIDKNAAKRIDQVIVDYQPTRIPPVDREKLLAALSHDKKFTREHRVMVLPKAIGDCTICEDITTAEIRYGMDAMLEAGSSSS